MTVELERPGFAQLLELETVDADTFTGWCHQAAPGRAFGGHVAAQALAAGAATVPQDRLAHSMHAYFIRPGRLDRPMVYQVERTRDGGSFTTRRVVAVQDGETVFSLMASFQRPETSPDHQAVMPKALPPEDPAAVPLEAWTATFGAIELLAVDQAPVITDPDRGPRRQAWVRAREQLGDDPVLNACALAYVSDIRLAGTAAMRHKPGQRFGPAVSLDHAIWFHRPFRLDEWLLFDVESPSYSSARGLARGEFYTRDGILVASVTQESLSRVLG